MKSILESINESEKKYNNFLNLPPITELGDGEHDCAVWGHSVACNGSKFYSEIGIRNIYPIKMKIIIKGGEVKFGDSDNLQRAELKKLFE